MKNSTLYSELKLLSERYTAQFLKDFHIEMKSVYHTCHDILPFDRVAEKIPLYPRHKRDQAAQGLIAILGVLLMNSTAEPEVFRSEDGSLSARFNGGRIQDISNWVLSRIHYGRDNTAISYLIQLNIPQQSCALRHTMEWSEDGPAAAQLAAHLLLPEPEREFIDSLIIRILAEKDYQKEMTENQYRIQGLTEKYLAMRLFKKAHHFIIDTYKISSEDFKKVCAGYALESMALSPGEYTAFLKYMNDYSQPLGFNWTETLLELGAHNKVWENSGAKLRNEIAGQLLSMNSRKSYHHNINDFKKILDCIRSDNEEIIRNLADYSVETEQGCYTAIQYIFNCDYGMQDVVAGFMASRNIISWLDSANGKEPKKPWLNRLQGLQDSGLSDSLKKICQWMVKQDDLRFDIITNWKDDVFTRFQKSAKWFLNLH